MDISLLQYDGGTVTTRHFADAFDLLGIVHGDVLLVHSDISVFGRLARPAREYVEAQTCR